MVVENRPDTADMARIITVEELKSTLDDASIMQKIGNPYLRLMWNEASTFLHGPRTAPPVWTGPTEWGQRRSPPPTLVPTRRRPRHISTPSQRDSGYDSVEKPSPSTSEIASPILGAQTDTESWVAAHTEVVIEVPYDDPSILYAVPKQEQDRTLHHSWNCDAPKFFPCTSWNVYAPEFVPSWLRKDQTTTKDATIEVPLTHIDTSFTQIETIEEGEKNGDFLTTTKMNGSPVRDDVVTIAEVPAPEQSTEIRAACQVPDISLSAFVILEPFPELDAEIMSIEEFDASAPSNQEGLPCEYVDQLLQQRNIAPTVIEHYLEWFYEGKGSLENFFDVARTLLQLHHAPPEPVEIEKDQAKEDQTEEDQAEETFSHDEKHDSGIEVSPTSDDERKAEPLVADPSTSAYLRGLENVQLAIYGDEYEAIFVETVITPAPVRKICAFGKCSSKCAENPCYSIDQMIEYNPTITEDWTVKKTARIFLDITGSAALIHLPYNKGLRLLAQELNSVVTDVVNIKHLEDCPSKYRFEIDITKFVRSSTPLIVYSTFPVSAFYRGLEDGFDPCERPQHMLTAGRGVEVRVSNLFLGTKQEFQTLAAQFDFSTEQRDVVTFLDAESDDDFLNQWEDFDTDAPADRKEEEGSDDSEEERLVRSQTLKRFNESRMFALGATIDDAKDVTILYCMENGDRVCDDGEAIALNHDQAHQTTQQEKLLSTWEELSRPGAEEIEITKSPADKLRTVHRVVAWLLKDDGSYDFPRVSRNPACSCEGCVPAPVVAEKVLSPTACALYESLDLNAKCTNEETPEFPRTKSTYEFTLVNLCEENAANHTKHIYLATRTDDIDLRFSPCTQQLTITSPSITACHQLDLSCLPRKLVGTQVHIATVPKVNCMIYSTQPIKQYTSDYTLPEVKGAPRQNKKVLSQYLKANCARLQDFAPYAVKYKVLLGNVSPKPLRYETRILGDEQGIEEEDDEE